MNSDIPIVTLMAPLSTGLQLINSLFLLLPVLKISFFRNRHVILPPQCAEFLPKDKLLNEAEWRKLGVVQSPGWVHYAHHKPEPHILLFRRQLDA